ncbi:sorbitol dehydrogenase-like [Pollicipes pollicipes]|uniref:sorbitol dehydrogenase-like n=1 Tax=Pollicipes pollicipes TaxID=41117 RepID=UPI0018858A14|nr:sorbitol dehydrogenase-like [Pollicipes pollicipes]
MEIDSAPKVTVKAAAPRAWLATVCRLGYQAAAPRARLATAAAPRARLVTVCRLGYQAAAPRARLVTVCWLGCQAAAPRARMVTVGRGPADVTLPIVQLTAKELDICGIFRYANCYQAALDLVASGRVRLDPLVTHRFSLEQSEQAFQTALEGRGIKVMIAVHKD